MAKVFYSHIVEVQTIITELDKMDLSKEEKMHLGVLVDSSLNHVVLDAILSELSDEDKKTFLKHLSDEDHNKLWEHLNAKVENIEEKIKRSAEEFKKELHRDIKEAHNKRGEVSNG